MIEGGERFTVHLDDLETPFDRGGDVNATEGYLETKSFVSIGIPIGNTIVANGCFDGCHPGHLSLFAQLDRIAYEKRLRPIVALNSDRSVRELKGPGRPFMPQNVRATLINNLKWPLTVVIFDEETPKRLMGILKPRYVLKGGQYDPDTVVRWNGSEVITVPMVDDWSTSKILGDTR